MPKRQTNVTSERQTKREAQPTNAYIERKKDKTPHITSNPSNMLRYRNVFKI